MVVEIYTILMRLKPDKDQWLILAMDGQKTCNNVSTISGYREIYTCGRIPYPENPSHREKHVYRGQLVYLSPVSKLIL